MASSVLVYTNSTPQEWSMKGAADHAAAINGDPEAPAVSSYVYTKQDGASDYYLVTLPDNLERLTKLVVTTYWGTEPGGGNWWFNIYKNGNYVGKWGAGDSPGSGGITTIHITGLDFRPGDVFTFFPEAISVGFTIFIYELRVVGTYTTEKQIQGSLCTEKTIAVALCTEKSVASSLQTGKVVASSPCTEKVILSTP